MRAARLRFLVSVLVLAGCEKVAGTYSVDVERTLQGIEAVHESVADKYRTLDEYREYLNPWLDSLSLSIEKPKHESLLFDPDYSFVVEKFFCASGNAFIGAIMSADHPRLKDVKTDSDYVVYHRISSTLHRRAGDLNLTDDGCAWIRADKGYWTIYFRK